jgi:uncharacterized membrane protein
MPPTRAATPDLLEALHRDGLLPQPAFERALSLSCASPGVQRWRRFLDWLLLGLGVVLLLVGVVFLVAFNWAALPAFVKLGVVASLVAGAALAAWQVGLEVLPGRIALTAAAVLVGPLLALYGQTYQTGADSWPLFAGWAAFIALWVAIARFPTLWLVELLLLNTMLGLWWDQAQLGARSHIDDERQLLVLLATVNAAAWATWEVGAWRGVQWLQVRWLPRLLAVVCLGTSFAASTSLLTASSSHEVKPSELLGLLLLLGLTVAALAWFHHGKRDLFMVATALGAAMTTFTVTVGDVLLRGHFELGAIFALGLLVIAEVAAAAWWLRTRHLAWGRS